jgi:hypothetical protein
MSSQICIIHGVNTLDKSKAGDVLLNFDHFWLSALELATEAAKGGERLATVDMVVGPEDLRYVVEVAPTVLLGTGERGQ